MQHSVLLYGANGYTGQLIARYAKEYGITLLLAGRSAEKISALSQATGFAYRVFELENTSALLQVLQEVKLVLHAAGPFAVTAKPMLEACLQTGAHYLDINGDISVFELIKQYDQVAKAKNIILLPGAGFDVVPTDCLALHLKKQLPDASHLSLAFASQGGGLSHGTAMTMAAKLGEGGAVRENGKIVRKPLGHKGRWIDFGPHHLFTMTIPWGDVFTAHITTSIPSIEVSTGIKPAVYRVLKLQFLFNWLLRTEWMRNMVRRKISQRPAGPSDAMRANAKSFVWGEVKNAGGEKKAAAFECRDGYTLTALSSLLIAQKILAGDFKPGYQTPAACYGETLIHEIPGTKWL